MSFPPLPPISGIWDVPTPSSCGPLISENTPNEWDDQGNNQVSNVQKLRKPIIPLNPGDLDSKFMEPVRIQPIRLDYWFPTGTLESMHIGRDVTPSNGRHIATRSWWDSNSLIEFLDGFGGISSTFIGVPSGHQTWQAGKSLNWIEVSS